MSGIGRAVNDLKLIVVIQVDTNVAVIQVDTADATHAYFALF